VAAVVAAVAVLKATVPIRIRVWPEAEVAAAEILGEAVAVAEYP